MKNVLFVDLKSQYQEIKNDVDFAVKKVNESGWYLFGEELASFEKEFAEYLGVKHVVGVHSGTDALTFAIKALDLKKGDGVVVPANVYPTSFGVSHSEVDLQLADVDPNTLNLSVESVKKIVTKKTKAIVVVHLYGNPVHLSPIKKYADDKGIYVIEDCAQACGAEYKDKKVGSIGDIACFSFYPTKNLGAHGDGGAVVTNKFSFAQKVKLWRMYGEKNRYDSVLVGHNSRLDEIQAAILRVKLKKLDAWNEKRIEISKWYKELLKGVPLEIVSETMNSKHVYHLFVIQTKKRNQLADYLKRKGIQTAIHYPNPIHLTKSYDELPYEKGDFSCTEISSKKILSLPMHPYLTKKDVMYVTSAVRSFHNL